MTIKELKEKLTNVDYIYISLPNRLVVAEFIDKDCAIAYAQAFKGIYWEYFPYKEYGYDDPYNFSNEWMILNNKGDIVEYDIDKNNYVVEVLKG